MKPYFSPSITGLILAGGQGRRMGKQDKGLLHFQSRPLIEYVIDILKIQVDSLLINANQNHDRYASYGYPVIADSITGFCGPLAGMLSGMRACKTPYLLTSPCDSIAISPKLRQRLMETLLSQQADIAVAHDGDRLQPVFCLLSCHLVDDLQSYLTQGERKIDRWFSRHRTVHVDFSDQTQHFININQPDDLVSASFLTSATPVIGFSAYSGTGKTTLLESLIPRLHQQNIRVAVIKHAHHQFEIDIPGKDSYRLRQAGAQQVMIASERLQAHLSCLSNPSPPYLNQLIDQLDHRHIDLILVEGFKQSPFPKIELYRTALNKPFLYPDDPHIIAIASDTTFTAKRQITQLNLNEIDTISDYLIHFIAKTHP